MTALEELTAEALAAAQPAVLLAALATATGDLSVLRDEWRPDPSALLDDAGGLGAAARADIGALGEACLRRIGVGEGARPEPPVAPEVLEAVLAFLVGEDQVRACLPLLRDELALGEEDGRAPRWSADALAPGRRFQVVVVGAGMSGILAAHRFVQAGLEVVVVEKNGDVGGTWLENTYPGCRVDVPSRLYSYSCAPRADWPEHYSTQETLLSYFRSCAASWDLVRRIRFRTEVVAARFDDHSRRWALHVRHPAGEEVLGADAVVFAVGQLNRPSVPDIPGAGSFLGPSFHSARWDHGVALDGRRVAVIGTGASAVQLVPAIAGVVGSLDVFQRTPNWLAPTPDYRQEVSPGEVWLASHLSSYAPWHRFWLFWRNTEGLLPALRADPGWDGGGRSVSALNDVVRQLLTASMAAGFADRPDLLAACLPDHPPGARRVIRDDGSWADALGRPATRLVTVPIRRIVPEGIQTADGVVHRAEVIVYATGFRASEFLCPVQVVGAGGRDLQGHWDGDARAYLGITVPGFPNLFLLYGPNTNIVINGSIVFFSECQVDYVVGCLQMLLGGGHRAMDCRPEVHDAYNERVDRENRAMAWGASPVKSWYKNARGRVSQNWPGTLVDYWRLTRTPDPADYLFS